MKVALSDDDIKDIVFEQIVKKQADTLLAGIELEFEDCDLIVREDGQVEFTIEIPGAFEPLLDCDDDEPIHFGSQAT